MNDRFTCPHRYMSFYLDRIKQTLIDTECYLFETNVDSVFAIESFAQHIYIYIDVFINIKQ